MFNGCTHACSRAGWRLIPRSIYRHNLGLDLRWGLPTPITKPFMDKRQVATSLLMI